MSDLKIPDDLQRLYDLGKQHRAWVRTADDVATKEGVRIGPHPEVVDLIERIAKSDDHTAKLETLVREYHRCHMSCAITYKSSDTGTATIDDRCSLCRSADELLKETT